MGSTDTPELESGEKTNENNKVPSDVSIIGLIAIGFRYSYNHPVIGFGMEMIGIGTIVFATLIAFLAGLMALSNLLGGWSAIYALTVLTVGTYGAYRRRIAE